MFLFDSAIKFIVTISLTGLKFSPRSLITEEVSGPTEDDTGLHRLIFETMFGNWFNIIWSAILSIADIEAIIRIIFRRFLWQAHKKQLEIDSKTFQLHKNIVFNNVTKKHDSHFVSRFGCDDFEFPAGSWVFCIRYSNNWQKSTLGEKLICLFFIIIIKIA